MLKILTDGRKATDSRDYLYGLLGLLQPSEQIPVDYTLSTVEVFTQASWQVMKSMLDFTWPLEQGGLSNSFRTPGLPTWCVHWTLPPYQAFQSGTNFDVQPEEKPDWEKSHCDVGAGSLNLLANSIGTIRLNFKMILDQTLSKAKRDYTCLRRCMDNLEVAGLRVSSNDELSITGLQPDFRAEFFRTVLRNTRFHFISDIRTTPIRRLETNDFADIKSWWISLVAAAEEDKDALLPQRHTEWITTSFHRNVESSAICLTEGNQLCMVPSESKPGDQSYHMRTCKIPLVLRSVMHHSDHIGDENSGDTAIPEFQVVGPAFLHCAMGSEGWRQDQENVIRLK